MRTREYKCYYCKNKIKTNEELIENKSNDGKKVLYRIHKTCFEFREKEKLELDSLVETIKKIYNIEIIPSSFYVRLQDLRNGNDTYNKVKKSKNGYRYKLIEYTYRKKYPDIKKTLPNINGSINQLNYGLAIVRNSINDVVLELKARNARKKELEKVRDEKVVTKISKEIVVDKKEKKKPLPDWL